MLHGVKLMQRRTSIRDGNRSPNPMYAGRYSCIHPLKLNAGNDSRTSVTFGINASTFRFCKTLIICLFSVSGDRDSGQGCNQYWDIHTPRISIEQTIENRWQAGGSNTEFGRNGARWRCSSQSLGAALDRAPLKEFCCPVKLELYYSSARTPAPDPFELATPISAKVARSPVLTPPAVPNRRSSF